MNTQNQKVAKIDEQIDSAATPFDVAEPKTHTQSIYWWLRTREGFSHLSAVLMTHSLECGNFDDQNGFSRDFAAARTVKDLPKLRAIIRECKPKCDEFGAKLKDHGDEPSEDVAALLARLEGLSRDDNDEDPANDPLTRV